MTDNYDTRGLVPTGQPPKPHAFVPWDETGESAACRSCGRNREDAVHGPDEDGEYHKATGVTRSW